MATLVLTSVGTAIGGPVGGALGGLLGQAFDTQLFGIGPRKGPRLDDLKVQTSSYGTQIPRLYGRMRVAGTVVWATDLKEGEAIEGGGKGGPEIVRYHYSCSFAVALSSRPIRSIGRVWADGKLIRGAAGDLKVKGSFRWTRGDEGQAADPLIASLEGQGGTPAYRGLALAIFEDLALAEFGERIPVLTFEVVADDGPVDLSAIVGDVSEGLVTVGPEEGPTPVAGFAAFGSDRRAAIEGLADMAPGAAIVGPMGPLRVLEVGDELGWSTDGKTYPARGEWSQDGAASLPAGLAIRYHDPDRDYQAGEMRAAMPGGRGELAFDSAAALTAGEAKRWAGQALARRWAGRDRLSLRLPPDFFDLEPGDRLQIGWRTGCWQVEDLTIERFAVLADCRRIPGSVGAALADGGRAIAQADLPLGRSTIRMFDIPDVAGLGDGKLRLHAAVSSAGGFKGVPLTTVIAGQAGPDGVAVRRARLGFAETVLAEAPAELVDVASTVVVALVDPAQVLLNADADGLDAGANLCMLGREVLQFGRADDLGGGRYRLSQFLRGRRGTEAAIGGHAVGETFIMLDRDALVPLAFDRQLIGQPVEASAHGVADDDADPPSYVEWLGDAANRALSPCYFRVDREDGLRLEWTSRSRAQWSWTDEVSDEPSGRFTVTLNGSGGQVFRTVNESEVTLSAEEMAALGTGPVDVSVVAVGTFANSSPLVAQFDNTGS